ncbi:MAG: proteinase [Acidimicrobiales bacterium]|nr:proteinase [Acidimicrobiales bacterium]
MTQARAWITALVALGLVAAGCSITGGSDGLSRAPVPRSSSALHWSGCDDGFECADLRVPLDYAHPTGKQLRLAMVRRPARDQGQRIGSLLMNPGGPGGSAIDLVESVNLPSALRDRFDIVGFDPRGVGRSSTGSCGSRLQKIYDADPTIDDAAERATYLQVSKAYVDACARIHKDLLPHLGTQDTARDMDQVRQALGDEKLTYVGFSYGTSIGQQYAHLFPTRIRAMVLDGVVDTGQTGLQGARDQGIAFERALRSFLADCARRSSCPLGRQPQQAFEQVAAAAEARPIPAPDADRAATPGVVAVAIGEGLYSRDLWPDLASALADAKKGDGSALVDMADTYLDRQPDGSYSNSFDAYFGVSCLDASWPKDPQVIFAAAKALAVRAPHVGEGIVNDYVRCALWPVPPKPLPTVTAPGSPPILVISTTGDPATPYAAGVAVAKRLVRGVLLTNVGEGHTVFTLGKACVDDAVTTYLVDLRPPANGMRCP